MVPEGGSKREGSRMALFGDSEPMPGRHGKERGMEASWRRPNRSPHSGVNALIAQREADARARADAPVENPNADELQVDDRVCSPAYWGEGEVRTILRIDGTGTRRVAWVEGLRHSCNLKVLFRVD